ncbi:MAG: hypothetical protein Q8Q09_29345 [Deltaproteobacteria bacterium]|nr:hypothetical protein [Deltaproteobacteria bacterium]
MAQVIALDPLAVFEQFLQHMRVAGAQRTQPRAPARESAPEGTPRAMPAISEDSGWDDKTKSRPDVAREYAQRSAQRVHHDQSIIVEDDLAMTQPMQSQAPELPARGELRGDRFCDEMLVLIKYGHSQQVPREIDRWVRAYPDDLEGQLRIAEFELQRVDANIGVERLFYVAQRSMERGAVDLLRRAMDRLAVCAAQDTRYVVLRQRLGLR